MNKAAVIKEDETINGCCFFNFIYKAVKGSDPIVDEANEIIYPKTFFEKIEESAPSMVKYWKDIK